jgi:hypothetical protein
MDLFVVPTLAFNLLYGLIIVRLDRRELVWIAVTNSPTDCTPDYRGVSLGVSAEVPDPRPRPRLRFRRETAPPRNGHSG